MSKQETEESQFIRREFHPFKNHSGVIGISDVAKLHRRLMHILTQMHGFYNENTRRYYVKIEASVYGCRFIISLLSEWTGADFVNKFEIMADARPQFGFKQETFEKIVAMLEGRETD
ncbi:MAG: hypothetical protein UT24_C0003G0040 [Candidatus Woesebacteria bacterium GW2011_GWB1_39_12]|uniref:Uncharacterized protein n=1 Tax=Candidatus Woesebacteria bacterium GW2011_GWB1_39_12 TaxID=1618574 RepID=A0A0G0MEM8_9BACT|nr:MAG: hypothetical protein UT24_C0003G0040 [Candidatus Woesebacteria bacterium GW2011_GWB1_39_12]